mgnify:CR=1 FL=1
MSEEILINITPMESRVAVVENGVLQEVHVERTQKRGIVGNIYKGKVQRVMPGMQTETRTRLRRQPAVRVPEPPAHSSAPVAASVDSPAPRGRRAP